MTALIKGEIAQFARPYLGIEMKSYRDFLIVPLHYIQGQLYELLRGEVSVQFSDRCVVKLSRLRHERISKLERDLD